MNKSYIETLKFVIRMALLVGVPMLVSWATKLTGQPQVIVNMVLPIALPIIDKFIHSDDRIPINGLLPL